MSATVRPQQSFEERMKIVDGVLADLQRQAIQKSTVEAAVLFQAVGAKKVVHRMRQEIESAR